MYNFYYLDNHREQRIAYSLTLNEVADKIIRVLCEGGEITGIIDYAKDC